MGWRRSKATIGSKVPDGLLAASDPVENLAKSFESDVVVTTRDLLDDDLKTRELPTFTPDEVEARNGKKHADGTCASVWLVIKDKVYDVSEFMLLEHPGGKDVIEAFAGKQCDWQFELFHHPRHLEQYHDALLVGLVSPVPPNPFPRPPRELKAAWRVE